MSSEQRRDIEQYARWRDPRLYAEWLDALPEEEQDRVIHAEMRAGWARITTYTAAGGGR